MNIQNLYFLVLGAAHAIARAKNEQHWEREEKFAVQEYPGEGFVLWSGSAEAVSEGLSVDVQEAWDDDTIEIVQVDCDGVPYGDRRYLIDRDEIIHELLYWVEKQLKS